jgi:uncharacterized protein (TIGR02147 family)
MENNLKKPVIFEYENYRRFLQDLYVYLKAEKDFFSYRYFSKAAGFRSPNFLKLVIDGNRNLTGDSVEKFAAALRLNKKEAEYFHELVGLNQAATVAEKKRFAERLFKFEAYKKLHPLQKEQHEYYARWYMVPIRELVALPGFREDAKWIAQTLRPPISPAEADKALADLQRLGLLKRDEGGKLVQSESIVSTGDEVASAAVAQFLKLMTLLGAEATDLFPANERDVSSVTLTLSEKNFAHVKSLVQKFRKELLAIADRDHGPEAVYQINFQLFPLTKVLQGKEGAETTKKKETS